MRLICQQNRTITGPCNSTLVFEWCMLNALVFIFAGNEFSADIRDKSAKHWSDESVFSNRAYFLFDKQNELAIQNIKDGDSGIYRCRVDFEIGQTRNSKVNLTVIREYINIEASTI